MNFTELLDSLQNLIPDTKIKQIFIANALNISRATISDRIKRNSEVTVSELKKIEDYFGVTIYANNKIVLKPEYNLGVQYDLDQWGKRLLKLQVASNMLSDKDFAKYINVSTSRLDDFIRKNKYPNGEEILNIKKAFSKTNIDWLLFGEGGENSD